MAKIVTHRSKVTTRRFHTVTGTLCGRMSNAADDLNVADTDDQITCKLCLRKNAARLTDIANRELSVSRELRRFMVKHPGRMNMTAAKLAAFKSANPRNGGAGS